MKQFVLSNIGMVPQHMKDVVENTGLDSMVSSPLRFRKPWELLWGNTCKFGVTVAGDALHPMTPDLGQGACSALEDGVVLARCIGAVFSVKSNVVEGEEEGEMVRKAIEKYVKERRWRSFELVTTGLLLGWTQQIGGFLMNFVRDEWLSTFLAEYLVRKAGFDVGTL